MRGKSINFSGFQILLWNAERALLEKWLKTQPTWNFRTQAPFTLNLLVMSKKHPSLIETAS